MINSVGILTIAPSSNLAPKVADDSSKPEGASGVTESPDADSKKPLGVASDTDSDAPQESDTVKQLKKQIEQLEKQLQEQQQALQSIESSNQSEEAKVAAVTSAQSQIVETAAALQITMSSLVKALTAGGGASTGSLVQTTA